MKLPICSNDLYPEDDSKQSTRELQEMTAHAQLVKIAKKLKDANQAVNYDPEETYSIIPTKLFDSLFKAAGL